MKTENRTVSRRLQSAFTGIIFVIPLLVTPSVSLGAGWTQGTEIAPSLPTAAPSVFAFNPAGEELWATAPGVTGGAVVQVAQRSFGGGWSTPATIATIHSVGVVTVEDLSISLSASNNAAAVWSVGGGVQIALRSTAGAWQAPVSFVPTGGASRLEAKLDAQGNGVAAWARVTSTGSVVEAVTWTASGAFGQVAQLSPSSQGAFLPDLAVNEVGASVVVWQVSGPNDAGNPYQVESASRTEGGAWSAAVTVSPVVPQTWSPQVALDGAGNATAVWEEGSTANNYRIFSATQAAGKWGSSIQIEPANWYMVGQGAVVTDTAGDATASWVVEDSGGNMLVHTATRRTGGAWGVPTSLGQLSSSGNLPNLIPPVTAARDGSITVVGWAAFAGTGNPNVAVRLGQGQWVPMVIGGNPEPTNVLATNNARASVVWPVANGVKYHHALVQSDYQ